MNQKKFFFMVVLSCVCLTGSYLYFGFDNFNDRIVVTENKTYLSTNQKIASNSFELYSSTCSVLINGDKKSIKNIPKVPISVSDEEILAKASKGCWNVISNYSFKYDWREITLEEENYPIAYSILAHHKTEQLLMLLAQIYSPQNAYCIHIDAKASNNMFEAVEAVVKCFPNVILASKRENVVYASFSRLQADINCMKDLLKSPIKWNHLINLCGQVSDKLL